MVEIDKEGHSFKFTRETGVNNYIEFVYNYILMDGTIVQGDKDALHFLLISVKKWQMQVKLLGTSVYPDGC